MLDCMFLGSLVSNCFSDNLCFLFSSKPEELYYHDCKVLGSLLSNCDLLVGMLDCMVLGSLLSDCFSDDPNC